MKNVTAVKMLSRYVKSLSVMENEARAQEEYEDAAHYHMGMCAFPILKEKEERSNTRS